MSSEIAVQSGDGIRRAEYESVGMLRLMYIAARKGVSALWVNEGRSRYHLGEVKEGSSVNRAGHPWIQSMSQ